MTPKSSSSRAKDGGTRPLFWDPLEIVTVKLGDKEYKIHKALLVKDSEYFQKALNGNFIEAQTQEIILGKDVKIEGFSIYVDVLYRSFFNPDLEHRPKHLGSFDDAERLLSFAECSDRFLNKKLHAIAEGAIEDYLADYTPTKWESVYAELSEERVHKMGKALERVALICLAEPWPYYDRFAEAFSNMPAQPFARLVKDLEPQFGATVTEKFAMRFAKSSRKRKDDKDSASKVTKKRKIHRERH